MQKLDLTRQTGDKDGIFAYKSDFNEQGAGWRKMFGLRLCGVISDHVINENYKVHYTATQSNEIHHNDEIRGFYRFCGALDLVIEKIYNE